MIPKSVENPANKSAKATVKNDDGYVRSYEDDVEMPSLTFRSVVLGLAACTFSSAITAVTIFRQSGLLNLTGPMVQIMSYIVGTLWARLLPCVERGTNKMLGGDSKWQRMVHFVNPGPFTIKEHAVVSIIASCTVTDEFAPIAIHKMFYADSNPLTTVDVICCMLAATLLGLGLAGIFSPILVDSPSAVWYELLTTVNFMQTLHFDSKASRRFRLFWYILLFVFCYEILPQFMFPLLAAFSIPCLAFSKGMQKRSRGTKTTFTNIFGSASINEGLGLLSLSLDWQYITSTPSPLVTPLQGLLPSWIGLVLCIVCSTALYYTNVYQAKSFPFLSTQFFHPDGQVYNLTSVLTHSILDERKLAEEGIPRLAVTTSFKFFSSTATIGAMVAWTILFWGRDIYVSMKTSFMENFRTSNDVEDQAEIQHDSSATQVGEKALTYRSPCKSAASAETDTSHIVFNAGAEEGIIEDEKKESKSCQLEEGGGKARGSPQEPGTRREDCEHYIAMRSYKTIPLLWYGIIVITAIICGVIFCARGNTTLKFSSYLVGIIIGTFLAPIVGLLRSRAGGNCYVGPVAKLMIGAALQPGYPLANSYFSMSCAAVMSQCLVLASHLKMGAYLRVPPRVVFVAIILGLAMAMAIQAPIMLTIIDRQRATLLLATGTNMWSGQHYQVLNQEAYSYSMTKYIYGPHGYLYVPLGFVFGIALSVGWYVLTRFIKKIGSFDLVKDFHMAILMFEIGYPISHHTNGLLTRAIVGMISCLYLKTRHTRFYYRQLPVLGAALDGGVAFTVLFITVAFGGLLTKGAVKFPTWPGNPGKDQDVFPDHCPLTSIASS